MAASVKEIADRLGVPENKVTEILKTDVDLSPGVIEGYARCINTGCTAYDADQPVPLQVTRTQRFGDKDGPYSRIALETGEHFHPVNDADIKCPDCGEARALLPEKRRSYPRMM